MQKRKKSDIEAAAGWASARSRRLEIPHEMLWPLAMQYVARQPTIDLAKALTDATRELLRLFAQAPVLPIAQDNSGVANLYLYPSTLGETWELDLEAPDQDAG